MMISAHSPCRSPAVPLPHPVSEEAADLVAGGLEDDGALARDAPVPISAAVPLKIREEVARLPREVAVRVGGLGRLWRVNK